MSVLVSLIKLPIEAFLLFDSMSNVAVALRQAPIERRWMLKSKEYIGVELVGVLYALCFRIGFLSLLMAALYVGGLFLQSTKGNEILPVGYSRPARRRTRNAICAVLSTLFALRMCDSLATQLLPALLLGVIAYFTVGSVQNIKRQLWRVVNWVESVTELSLPASGKVSTAATAKKL